ncbi:hypothetical protein NIES2135_27290 [Leptolyngbya boryana NIES-2135]|jgi:hypothetical protein|uniref:Uncharacterized protein n=1 Tax=Leptolyngbya boryana NIES-2135 TaxID=1973484 RepID=A0A1Z4JGL0_LEPBY|nr:MULTISPECIES: hypothetical protein [Leptolyngbya]BAY55904.1 hypothetical protein NIES2135_27290 [Leptolyngbya boryana NIES-2135]MBD2368795.1 hypothetical protein [Leptolyngbya sp. FACHB-161]MBD2375337.1 hypothetical protein [Leptolyngbya sp. FACHB-238]MBD2399755.1 hypothetical protein [Leptolyngbya sp. FACHB-239]MBD2405961.1 hypothetical protein [Leptolyngbya sp. FACHB-402]
MSLIITFLIAIALALILRWIYRSLLGLMQSFSDELEKDDERKKDGRD